MSVSVKKIDGVSDVKVSLKEGLATIRFAPTNRVTLSQLRKAVVSNGFAPRAAEVRAAGVLAPSGDSLLLVIGGSADSVVLADGRDASGQVASLRRQPAGRRVVVTGQLQPTRSKAGGGLPVLLVQSFSSAEVP